MIKQLRFLLFFFIVICSCHGTKKKIVYLEYENNRNNCDSFGIPIDSSSTYFPGWLFKDTIPQIKIGNRVLALYFIDDKEDYAKEHNINPSEIKDTFELAKEDFLLRFESYALFKMNEPILYDHYLKKDTYRMIAFRSLSNPLLVRIEKDKKETHLIIKKLNKSIRYPFLIYSDWQDSLFYTTPDIAYYDTALNKMIIKNSIKYNKLYNENKRYHDSIAKIVNVIDYYLKIDTIIKAPSSLWTDIQTMVDSTGFWTSRPNAAPGYMQIDGSRWILEGHTKNGYQFKLIPSPNFDNRPYENYFDKNDQYVRIFKFILNSALLNDEPQY